MVRIMIGAAVGLLLATTAGATVFVAISPDVVALTAENDNPGYPPE
ncbi:hypothetical protein [Curtobacterium pusillum]|nr:hypothetical protein [Curtobacterium pusillum]